MVVSADARNRLCQSRVVGVHGFVSHMSCDGEELEGGWAMGEG